MLCLKCWVADEGGPHHHSPRLRHQNDDETARRRQRKSSSASWSSPAAAVYLTQFSAIVSISASMSRGIITLYLSSLDRWCVAEDDYHLISEEPSSTYRISSPLIRKMISISQGFYKRHCVYLPAMTGWFICSAALSAYNKVVFGRDHGAFPCPLLLTSIHFLGEYMMSWWLTNTVSYFVH